MNSKGEIIRHLIEINHESLTIAMNTLPSSTSSLSSGGKFDQLLVIPRPTFPSATQPIRQLMVDKI
jgi:hypothetical protein